MTEDEKNVAAGPHPYTSDIDTLANYLRGKPSGVSFKDPAYTRHLESFYGKLLHEADEILKHRIHDQNWRDEIAQTACIGAIKALPGYDPDMRDSFMALFTTICHNARVNAQHSSSRRIRYVEGYEGQASNIAGHDQPPLQQIIDDEERTLHPLGAPHEFLIGLLKAPELRLREKQLLGLMLAEPALDADDLASRMQCSANVIYATKSRLIATARKIHEAQQRPLEL